LLGPCRLGVLQQVPLQRLEQLEAPRVEAEPLALCLSGSGFELGAPRSLNRSDQVVEEAHLPLGAQAWRGPSRVVAQFVQRFGTSSRRDADQLVLDLGSGESPRDAAPARPRGTQVVEEFPRLPGEVKVLHEGHVAGDRTLSLAGSQRQAGQADGAADGVVRAGVEEERSVLGRLRLEGAAIDDDRAGEIGGGDPLPIATDHLVQGLVGVPGVEAGADFPCPARFDSGTNCPGGLGVAEEDLRLAVKQKTARKLGHRTAECK
jgi:hypothetical protein